MADAVDSWVRLNSGDRYIITLQNLSDGTGEAAVNKVDISTLTNGKGDACTKLSLDRAVFMISSGMSVQLLTDHTADDQLVTMTGVGDLTFDPPRGDPASAGGTGDLLLTTHGHAAGDSYDITLYLRKL